MQSVRICECYICKVSLLFSMDPAGRAPRWMTTVTGSSAALPTPLLQCARITLRSLESLIISAKHVVHTNLKTQESYQYEETSVRNHDTRLAGGGGASSHGCPTCSFTRRCAHTSSSARSVKLPATSQHRPRQERLTRALGGPLADI